jgi:hypothetical protein
MKNTQRKPQELVKALDDHLCLLLDNVQRLESGDEEYYKPLVAELRVLACKGKGNKLLFRVADQYGLDPIVITDGRSIPLVEYLGEGLFCVPIPQGQKLQPETYLTRETFITKAAQQEGTGHESNVLDNDYLNFGGRNPHDLFSGITIDGEKPHIRQAIRIAHCVYECGVVVLNNIKSPKLN